MRIGCFRYVIKYNILIYPFCTCTNNINKDNFAEYANIEC